MSRAEVDLPTFPPGQFHARGMSDIYGFDTTNSVWRRISVDSLGRLITSGGGGGGAGVTDTDDNSIVAGQATLLAINENYFYNGTDWIRWQGGVDNAAAPAIPQFGFVGGKVTSPLDAYVDGDACTLNFDTGGRLITAAPPGSSITTIADAAVGALATVALTAPPAGTRKMTVQNTGPVGTFIRVRASGDPAGSGIVLGRFDKISYGGGDGALAALVVQDVANIATEVALQFEG